MKHDKEAWQQVYRALRPLKHLFKHRDGITNNTTPEAAEELAAIEIDSLLVDLVDQMSHADKYTEVIYAQADALMSQASPLAAMHCCRNAESAKYMSQYAVCRQASKVLVLLDLIADDDRRFTLEKEFTAERLRSFVAAFIVDEPARTRLLRESVEGDPELEEWMQEFRGDSDD